jgi:hypothetical protein
MKMVETEIKLNIDAQVDLQSYYITIFIDIDSFCGGFNRAGQAFALSVL